MNEVNIYSPGIAIICNAWHELNQDIHKKFFQLIVDTIANNPSIEYILLSASHVNLTKENQGPNKWFDNSQRVFVDEQGVDWVRRLWQQAVYESQSKAFVSHNSLVRDFNYNGKLCIGVWEQWQLEWLLNHEFPHIDNVWYFGAGLGPRRDPIGWAQLCDLIKFGHVKNLNILTHQFGMLNNGGSWKEYSFEYIEWEKIDGWTKINDETLVKTNLDW